MPTVQGLCSAVLLCATPMGAGTLEVTGGSVPTTGVASQFIIEEYNVALSVCLLRTGTWLCAPASTILWLISEL